MHDGDERAAGARQTIQMLDAMEANKRWMSELRKNVAEAKQLRKDFDEHEEAEAIRKARRSAESAFWIEFRGCSGGVVLSAKKPE